MGQNSSSSGRLSRATLSGSSRPPQGSPTAPHPSLLSLIDAGNSSNQSISSGWHEEVLRQTKALQRVSGISYEEFLSGVREVNAISARYLDENGKQLVFAIKKGSDDTLLWKATVRVACVKVDTETKKVESCKTLSLKEFVLVYARLKHQADAAGLLDETAKPKYEDVPEDRGFSGAAKDSPDECCICLERERELILPCAHSYCLPCIEQWNVNNKTCPVCRETLDSVDDGWVVSEGPDSQEIATEIQKTLMRLAH